MDVIIFGATGMVGGGVLAECLRDPGVTHVVVVGRRPTGVQHAKLREIVEADVTRLAPHEAELRGLDACFFCLGVSAAGMSEARYTELTYDLTLAAARELARVAPAMTFVYVSGMGTDSSEKGRSMWARVKGRTENALMALPFRAAYMFRPGLIHADEGGPSSTTWYRFIYVLMKPLLPLLKRAFPDQVLTTREIGRAMLAVARTGYERRVLEARDIVRVARAAEGAR